MANRKENLGETSPQIIVDEHDAIRLAVQLRGLELFCRLHIEGRLGEKPYRVVAPQNGVGSTFVFRNKILNIGKLVDRSRALPGQFRFDVLALLYEFHDYIGRAVVESYGHEDNTEHLDKVFSDAIVEAHSVCGRRLLQFAAKCDAWWIITHDGQRLPKVANLRRRFKPSPCPKCNSKVKVGKSPPGSRLLECTKCGWTKTTTRS